MRNWIILIAIFFTVGALSAQGPGMGGGRGGHGGPRLTDDQRTEMGALRDSLVTVGATLEEIRTAMAELLTSWGFDTGNRPSGGRGHFGGLQLTDDQRTEMAALRDSLVTAGATRREIRTAVRDLLTGWGIQPQRDHYNGGAQQDRPNKQRRIGRAFNQPNPFNPSTRIGYNLTVGSSVAIAIYDIQGRLIRNYIQGYQPIGLYAVEWDGTLASGQPAPSGVYFYRIAAGDEVTAQRMLLMK